MTDSDVVPADMASRPGASPIEHGDPAADARAFRRTLGQFATGVTVITACHEGRCVGMTVNSFAALSLEPALVVWSIRRESGKLQAFQQAVHFAVNVLGAHQVALSNRFASNRDDASAAPPWLPGQCGSPLLQGAIAHLECRLQEAVDGGDHLLLIGRVLRHARFAGEPLLFTQGRYAVTQEHPDATHDSAAVAESGMEAPRGEAGRTILRLLHATSAGMSQTFLQHRLAEGLSVAQFRIFGWLRHQPHSAEALRRLAYLGSRDADDTLAQMRELGLVLRDQAGLYHLTPLGRERAFAIVDQVRAFEAELLAGVCEADLAATRRVLGLLAERTAIQDPFILSSDLSTISKETSHETDPS